MFILECSNPSQEKICPGLEQNKRKECNRDSGLLLGVKKTRDIERNREVYDVIYLVIAESTCPGSLECFL